MRFSRRVLPALVLAIAAFAPVAPASADNDYCMYFRWDGEQRRWELVALLQEEAREHEFDWDCKYCYLQMQLHRVINDILEIVNDTVPPVLELVQDQTAALLVPVGGPIDSPVSTVEDSIGVDVPEVPLGPVGGSEDGPGCPHDAPLVYVVSANLIRDFP